MRGRYRLLDDRQRGLGLAQNVLVGHANDTNPLGLQLELSSRVGLSASWIIVDRAVYLDYQLKAVAVEVNGIRTNGVLAAELVIGEPAVSEKRPEPLLCRRGLFA